MAADWKVKHASGTWSTEYFSQRANTLIVNYKKKRKET